MNDPIPTDPRRERFDVLVERLAAGTHTPEEREEAWRLCGELSTAAELAESMHPDDRTGVLILYACPSLPAVGWPMLRALGLLQENGTLSERGREVGAAILAR